MSKLKSNHVKVLSIIFTVVAFLGTSHTYAQDKIYLKSDSSEIIVKILEVNSTNLKYKKYSNLEGPTYTIEKNSIEKVIFENGEIETFSSESLNTKSVERQTSQDLIPGSRLFLTYANTESEDNVDGDDATGMLKTYIEGKTNCIVVNSIDEADFVIELRVIKKAMAERSAKIEIKHILSEKIVFETKWVRKASSAFYGYSGSRAAIGKVVKKYLLKKYPKVEI